MTNLAEQTTLVEQPKLRIRPWMPQRWRAAVSGRRVVLRICEPVKRRCKKPALLTPSALSLLHRRMPAAEGHPGAYRFEFAKHARKVMDTWAKPWVREVWFCGVDQASKTNCMLSCIFWAVDQAPGNIFYQMPSADASDKIMGQKLNPMLRESARTAVHVSPRADDTSLGKTALTNGVTILPAHAGSVTSTATFAATYTFSDEVDKMEMVGKEASPIVRIRKRTRTKKFGKHFFASTPAGKYIHKGAMDCVQVWEGTAKCPACGQLMGMSEEQVIIPEGITTDEIKASAGLIEYACDQCGHLLNETDRAEAYARIVSDNDAWRCIKGADIAEPVDVGFILSAFPLPDVPLTDIAKTIIKAKAGDLSAKRDLAHGIKAVDYVEELSDRKEDGILALCDDRPAGMVPTWADLLEISIDTQDNGWWYRIRAWQYGPEMQSALVQCGFVQTFGGLDQLIYDNKYFDSEGRGHRIGAGIIDSAGHKTSEVYDWCRRPGSVVITARGASGRKTVPVTTSRIDNYPGTNKPIPGGLRLYHIDTHFAKDALAGKLAIVPGDPGSFWLHSGYSDIQLAELQRSPGIRMPNGLEQYARQMCAEFRDERGLWQNPTKKANHLWDCESNGMALVLYLKIQSFTATGQASSAESKSIERKTQPSTTRRRW